MNLIPETIESGQGKSQMALYPTPGLSLYATLPGTPARGGIQINGRCFFVAGGNFCEITGLNAYTTWGNVGSDGQPVTMKTNGSAGNQILICSAGVLYVFNVKTNTFTAVGGSGVLEGVPSLIEWFDGYFLALLAGTNKFQVSNLEDGTTWNPLGVQEVSVFPENIGGMLACDRLLYVWGLDGHGQVYYNSGANAYTPFDIINGAFMEEGIDAALSMARIDNAPFWIGGNENGAGFAWRANGYSPMRISNHAIETAWSAYPNQTRDAVSWSYRENGHTFYLVRFPSANNGRGATWAYDAATQMWHERTYWSLGQEWAHLAGCHVFWSGLHLVGDWRSGNVYHMAQNVYQDNNALIRRVRRAPHISNEQTWIRHQEMQVDLEVGDGPIPPLLDGAGNPRDPQICLRWSDDGGQTWSNEHWVGAGQAGTYKTRAHWHMLGKARDRVYEISVTDPIAWRFVDAYLEADGFKRPMPRMLKTYMDNL